jgi:hypothetical protein
MPEQKVTISLDSEEFEKAVEKATGLAKELKAALDEINQIKIKVNVVNA